MGILKLQNLYKKKSKRDTTANVSSTNSAPIDKQSDSLVKIRPLSLHLDHLDWTESTAENTGLNKDDTIKDMLPQQQGNNINNSRACGGSKGLFDHVSAELNNNIRAKDSVDQDFLLATTLSQQLQLEHDGKSYASNNNANTAANAKNKQGIESLQQTIPAADKSRLRRSEELKNFNVDLFASDSIYSSYTRNLAALENRENRNSFSTSMFDHLLNPTSSQISRHAQDSSTAEQQRQQQRPTNTTTTTTVLDSDVSDSDDDNDEATSKVESDEESDLSNNMNPNLRMTKGIQPIMERRGGGDPTNSRLFIQRKIDSWANRVDPESNRIEANEAVIQRMRDRHRLQVKMAALRQQKLQGGIGVNGGVSSSSPYQHMVPQQGYYGSPMSATPPFNVLVSSAPAAPPPNVAMMLPTPTASAPPQGMMPFQMYYQPAPPHTPLTPLTVPPNNAAGRSDMQPLPKSHSSIVSVSSATTVPIPEAFLPNPNHNSLASTGRATNDDDAKRCSSTLEQTQVTPSFTNDQTTSSLSSITSLQQKSKNSSKRQSIRSQSSSTSTKKSLRCSSHLTATVDPTPNSQSESLNVSMTKSSELTTSSDDEEEDAAAEADVESISEEEEAGSRSSVRHPTRSKTSLTTKLRQQQQQHQQQQQDSNNNNLMAMRPSQSTPNFRKAKHHSSYSSSSGHRHYTSSNATSSRRNSQETTPSSTAASSPLSEVLLTPPPPPLPPHPHYVTEPPQQLLSQERPALQPRSSSLRNMKSESDLKASSRESQQQQQQQQQLKQEWERMQQFRQPSVHSPSYQQQQPMMTYPTTAFYYTPATMLPPPYYYQMGMSATPQMNPHSTMQTSHNNKTNSTFIDYTYQQNRSSHMAGLHFVYSNNNSM